MYQHHTPPLRQRKAKVDGTKPTTTPRPHITSEERREIVSKHGRIASQIHQAAGDSDDEEARLIQKRIAKHQTNTGNCMIKLQLCIITILFLILASAYVSLVYLRPNTKSTKDVNNTEMQEDSFINSLTKAMGILSKGNKRRPTHQINVIATTTSISISELNDCVYPNFWSSSSSSSLSPLNNRFVVPPLPKFRRLKNILHQIHQLQKKGVIIDLYDKERIRSSLEDENNNLGKICNKANHDEINHQEGYNNDHTIMDQYHILDQDELSQAQIWLWRMCMIYSGQAKGFIDLETSSDFNIDIDFVSSLAMGSKEEGYVNSNVYSKKKKKNVTPIWNTVVQSTQGSTNLSGGELTAITPFLFISNKNSIVVKGMINYLTAFDAIDLSDVQGVDTSIRLELDRLVRNEINNSTDLSSQPENHKWTLLKQDCNGMEQHEDMKRVARICFDRGVNQDLCCDILPSTSMDADAY